MQDPALVQPTQREIEIAPRSRSRRDQPRRAACTSVRSARHGRAGICPPAEQRVEPRNIVARKPHACAHPQARTERARRPAAQRQDGRCGRDNFGPGMATCGLLAGSARGLGELACLPSWPSVPNLQAVDWDGGGAGPPLESPRGRPSGDAGRSASTPARVVPVASRPSAHRRIHAPSKKLKKWSVSPW